MTREMRAGNDSNEPNGQISSDENAKLTPSTISDAKKEVVTSDALPDGVSSDALPDGGWGWMVVFGSFVIHVIADGVYYSFGVFLVALIEYFEVGRGEAGWVGSILIGTLLSVGPIASVMTNTMGCRLVVTIGTLLTFIGFIVSMFAPNIYFLYVSIGIVGGTGLGLAYLPAIVSISYYFEKKRSFATGIAVCGSGIGTMIFAPLSQLLLDEYGWKGALLIESGLLLNCIPAGLLFRPVEIPQTTTTTAEPEVEIVSPNELEEDSKTEGKARPKLTLDLNKKLPDDAEMDAPKQLSPRVLLLKKEAGVGGAGLSSSMHLLPTSKEETQRKHHHKSDLHLHKDKQQTGAHEKDKKSHPEHHHHHLNPLHPVHQHLRKDAFYTGSLENIPMYKQHRDEYRQSMLALPHPHHEGHGTSTKQHTTDAGEEESTTKCQICSEENKAELKESMDLGLFKDVLFEMFAWSNFLTNFAFFVPYMFLPDRAILLDINKKYASSLVSQIGISNTIGRLIFGFLADRKFVNRLMLYNTAVTVAGVVTIFSSLAYNFYWLSAYAISYGLLIGVYVTLTPIIIVDLLGIEKLSNAFGLVMFFQGVATLLGPPIAGWFFDKTGSYLWPFVLFGSMLALSGIMLYPIPCVRRVLDKKKGVPQHDVDMGRKVASLEYIAVPHAEEDNRV